MDHAFRRGNHFLEMYVASMVPVAPYHCRLWYTWRLVTCQIMVAAVEAILVLQGQYPCSSMSSFWLNYHLEVYALYNRSQRIAILLGSLIVAEVSTSTVNSYSNLPKMQFDSVCLTKLALLPVIQYGCVISPVTASNALSDLYTSIISLCTQTTILFLTFAKQIFAQRSGCGKTPIVSLMIRDGVFAFVVIFSEPSYCSRATGWC